MGLNQDSSNEMDLLCSRSSCCCSIAPRLIPAADPVHFALAPCMIHEVTPYVHCCICTDGARTAGVKSRYSRCSGSLASRVLNVIQSCSLMKHGGPQTDQQFIPWRIYIPVYCCTYLYNSLEMPSLQNLFFCYNTSTSDIPVLLL